MKRLADEIDLSGELENISMMDLRSRPGEILTATSMGKTYVIHRAGKPIATLSRVPGETLIINIDGKGNKTYVL
jgi:antitoxin (DNA-binding transcriptional repressor) of toxin-antitoxin stability system